MWYEKANQIRKDRPIFCKNIKNGNVYLLLPQIGAKYEVIGYNWFNIKAGRYNSCTFFETVEQAIACYKGEVYWFFNGKLSYTLNILEEGE